MADIVVAILSALVVLLLSFVYWKWQTQRNSLASEANKKPRLSRTDMLKTRVERFGLQEAGDDSSATVSSTSFPKSVENDETGPERGVHEDLGNEGQPNSAHRPPSQSVYSKKWVKLSISDSDVKYDPVTRPLTNLDELLAWTEGFDEFNVSSVALNRVGKGLNQRPRTIVCHDMKGGYVQDRFVQGHPSSECYRIYHWQYIDIFIYFSHNFITIPPPCWINAAHKHGVAVLGTFITEWDDGALRCADIFKDRFSYRKAANQLVLIAKYYGFEGWLINIENHVQPAQMGNLVEFMKYLTDEMHEVIPSSLVIWYDSVTYKGELKWQNKLNAENRVFFDMCDGIFLNYGWNPMELALSARAAGPERRYDVYVGVDVFGRGVFGGGGWNTKQATHVIKENDLSMALFAPGWVYEKYESTFKPSQDKFWTSIAPDCANHALGPCLPFVTSFCQGYGKKWFTNGKAVFDGAWTHLSGQELQPSHINQVYTLGVQNGVLINTVVHQTEDSYRGGGCLTIKGSTKLTTSPSKAVIRLFKTDTLLPSTVVISFTFKMEANSSMDVVLQLHVDKKPNYVMLCPVIEENIQDSEEIDTLNKALIQRYNVPRSGLIDSSRFSSISVGQEHYRSFVPLIGDHHNRMAEMCCDEDEHNDSWCTRYYLLAQKELKGSHIKEIRLVLINETTAGSSNASSSTPFQLFLGEIKIIDAVALRKPVPTAISLKCLESQINSRVLDSDKMEITLTLSWSYDGTNTEAWKRFEIYHLSADRSIVLLGIAYALSYVVSGLVLSRSQKDAQFIVRAVGCNERKQNLKDCPTITVYWS